MSIDILKRKPYFFLKKQEEAMQEIIHISTDKHNGLYDITRQVEAIVEKSDIQQGLASVYVQGATAAIMIQ